MIAWYPRVAGASAVVQLKGLAAQHWGLVFLDAQPFVVAVVAVFLLRNRPDFEAIYVVVGTTLTALLTGFLFFGGSQMDHERQTGTLEIAEASPTPLFVVVAGKMIGSFALSVTAAVVGYAVAAWLFGYPITVREPAGFVVSAALTLASLWTLGMLFSTLSFLWPSVHRLLTGMEYPIYLLGGLVFPIAVLPGWLQPFSYVLPPYWAAQGLLGTSSQGLGTEAILGAWAALIATSAVALVAAIWLYRLALEKARREGRLGWT